jgi:hypothetical protein
VENTDRYTYQNKTGDSQTIKFITKTKYQLHGINFWTVSIIQHTNKLALFLSSKELTMTWACYRQLLSVTVHEGTDRFSFQDNVFCSEQLTINNVWTPSNTSVSQHSYSTSELKISYVFFHNFGPCISQTPKYLLLLLSSPPKDLFTTSHVVF